MKKLMTILAVAVVLMVAGGNSYAQAANDAFEKAVAEYMEVTNARTTMVNTLVQAYQAMNLPVTNVEAMTNELLDSIWDKYIMAEAKIMQEYYSLEDLKEIIAFYRTPVGKKFAACSPEVAQKSAQIMMGQEFQGPMQQIILKYMK